MGVMVVVGALASVIACSRTSSSDSGKWPGFTKAKAETAAANVWQLKCDKLCDVHAKAASLESLCAASVVAAKTALGDTKCVTRHASGFPAIPASAVTDAAIVELTAAGKAEHTGFLALKTAAGWQLARPVGAGVSISTGNASPVDVPGLAPAGVQLQVAVSDASGKSERMFVCGLTGEGNVHCPVALEVGSNKGGSEQLAAFARGSAPGWKVAVEVTPSGYVATRVAGSVPAGLAGEHGWDAVPH